MATVYILTSPSGKKYIGKTAGKLNKRLQDHFWSTKRQQTKFANALKKYPSRDQWHVESITCNTEEDAYALEQKMIVELRTTEDEFGYNLSIGGGRGPIGLPKSEETKAKLRAAMTGRKLTEEHKAKIVHKPGYRQPESQKRKVAAALAKTYDVTFPDGHTERITNLNQFCKQNSLDQPNLSRRGKHKGFSAQLVS